jgi:hypothetical protein
MSEQTESTYASGQDLADEVLYTFGRRPNKLLRHKIQGLPPVIDDEPLILDFSGVKSAP